MLEKHFQRSEAKVHLNSKKTGQEASPAPYMKEKAGEKRLPGISRMVLFLLMMDLGNR
ncbi:MAG: hypothetical protein IK099_15480 [Clostridia bacterium]|nr:hypothetical protein [Clostridia bacterium]